MATNPDGTPIVEATSVEQPVVTAPVPVSLKDDDLVEIVWKGEKITKPWKQARNEMQMQEDYTRSKQEIAQQAKELRELHETVQSRSASVAEKELALDKILGRATPSPVVPADDEVVTMKSVREMLAEFGRGFKGEVDQTIQNNSIKTQEQAQFQRFESLTSEAVEALQKEHPILGKIPELDTVLKKSALKDKPTNEREMVTALVKAGKALAKTIDDDYTERRKAEVTRKEKLQVNAPIPGGSPSFKAPEGKNYIKKGSRNKIDWDSIEQDAIAAAEGDD